MWEGYVSPQWPQACFPAFPAFFVFACDPRWMTKHTSGDCNDAGTIWVLKRLSSDSPKVPFSAKQSAAEMCMFGKRGRKQASRGWESGNDLSLLAHENQMFSRTPRHPVFVMHQHPEDPGIPHYSLTFSSQLSLCC